MSVVFSSFTKVIEDRKKIQKDEMDRRINWLEKLLEILWMNNEMDNELKQLVPLAEEMSLADAAFTLPKILEITQTSVLDSLALNYLNIFERHEIKRWKNVVNDLLVKNQLIQYNNKFKMLLTEMTDCKRRLSLYAIEMLDEFLKGVIHSTVQLTHEIHTKVHEIKFSKAQIRVDISDIQSISKRVILAQKSVVYDNKMNDANSTNKVNEELAEIKLKTSGLMQNVHKAFTEAKEINDLLEKIDKIQKEMPSKIIQYMSYQDLDFLN